jgi:tRNA pseudouridine55 synthase
VDISVQCSTGTYIRQLAVDLGEHLGCGGYCETLRRTHVGNLSIDDSTPLDDIRESDGRPLLEGLGHLSRRDLSREEAVEIGHGRKISADETPDPVALVGDGALIAVGRRAAEGLLRTEVVLR